MIQILVKRVVDIANLAKRSQIKATEPDQSVTLDTTVVYRSDMSGYVSKNTRTFTASRPRSGDWSRDK